MPASQDSSKKERPSTYFVQDKEKKEELLRLTIQGQMLSRAMGGPFSEQSDPAFFQRILDIACGPGDWALEVARSRTAPYVIGIDISQLMIDYANQQAHADQLAPRVSFRVMDALEGLKFPAASFDLVNMRLGSSFLRTWDWPRLLNECLRTCRPGGIIRLTEPIGVPKSSSSALVSFFELALSAFYRAGHYFAHEDGGITAHLPRLLIHQGCQDIQTHPYTLEFHAGTPGGQAAYENLLHFQIARPFFQKWGVRGEDFDKAYRQALEDAQQEHFWLSFPFLTVWGKKA